MKCLFGIVAGFMLLACAIDLVSAEPLPSDYGHNVCVTKRHDMAVSQDVYSDFARELHFIGCEGGKRLQGTCSRLAYDVARDWMKQGQPILNLTVDKMGRALDGRMRNNKGMKAHDCTLNGDWIWS